MPPRRKPSTPSPKPEEKPKRGRGHPGGDLRFTPSREQRLMAEFMAGAGIPEEDMARVILNPSTGEPISAKTLRKHFRQELDGGQTKADAQVARGLYKNATTATETYPGGIPVAQIFWLKTRARWRTADKDTPPPPSAPTSPEQIDEIEQVRRLSFMLAKGAAAVERVSQPPTKHTKKKITIPG